MRVSFFGTMVMAFSSAIHIDPLDLLIEDEFAEELDEDQLMDNDEFSNQVLDQIKSLNASL